MDVSASGNCTRSRWAPAWLNWRGFGIEERGISVKCVVFRNKMMFRLRAASCCIPRVPVLLNKGVTKQENYDFYIFFSPFVSHITGVLAGTHCSSSSFLKGFLMLSFETIQLAQFSRLDWGFFVFFFFKKRSWLLVIACVSIFQIIYYALRNKKEAFS